MVAEVHYNKWCDCVWSLSFRSARMGYVQMLGFELNQSVSGMISTLTSLVVLMSMSTTAHGHGGIFTFLFSDTVALDVG